MTTVIVSVCVYPVHVSRLRSRKAGQIFMLMLMLTLPSVMNDFPPQQLFLDPRALRLANR